MIFNNGETVLLGFREVRVVYLVKMNDKYE